ncbi:MAG: amidophosphoribosyltransferase, partial [Candidatus Binatia bacterium]
MGLVADAFKEDVIKRLEGQNAIGHNRYSTQGQSHLKNAQPFVVEYSQGPIAIAHNGNLVNGTLLRNELEQAGSIFQSTSDTEVIIHLIATSKEPTLMGRIVEALSRCRGAYSLQFLTLDKLIAARDPYGFRPLVLGRFPEGKNRGAYVFASETCALDLIEAEYVRDVEPGEIVTIGADGLESLKPFPPVPHAKCIFEYIYFARPDSKLFGHNVYQVRKSLGRQLARESGIDADLVTPVPDSGVPAAMGFAEESKIPLEFGLIRNHYVGRTFIEPQQTIRNFGVKIKLNAQRDVLQGKRVIVVDDSIVRGTTSRKIIRMLRDAGAREVHLRISSPATTGPCYYGIDTPTRGELIASANSVEEIRRFVEADTLAYLSNDGMYTYFDGDKKGFCDACFTGNYPVHFEDEGHIKQLHLFDALNR